jgi:hypothetical protein
MDWNELRTDWQTRRDAAPAAVDLRPAARERLWRRVRIRDGLETAVALLMLPLFGFAAVRLAQAGFWVSALFAAGLVATLVYIPLRLRRARRRIPVPDPGRPVLEFLRAERDALSAQADMLRTVARWYSGPICVGVVGFFVGLAGFTLASLLYTLFVAGLFAAIEYANRAAVSKRFEPALERVEQQISNLQQES